MALNRELSGGVKILSNGTAVPVCAPPHVGDSLYFGDDGQELITSRLCDVERPVKQLVAQYPS
jgi:hypothetical protein